MKNIIIIFLVSIMLSCSANAGTDGENILSKKNKPVKDCFESLNRGTFALNNSLDKLFSPSVPALTFVTNIKLISEVIKIFFISMII